MARWISKGPPWVLSAHTLQHQQHTTCLSSLLTHHTTTLLLLSFSSTKQYGHQLSLKYPVPRPSDLIVGPLFLRCSHPIQPTSRLRDKDPRQRTSSRLLLSSRSPFSILYTPDQQRPTDLLLLFGTFLETTLFLRQLAISIRPTLQSNGRLSHHTCTSGFSFQERSAPTWTQPAVSILI